MSTISHFQILNSCQPYGTAMLDRGGYSVIYRLRDNRQYCLYDNRFEYCYFN